MGTGSTSNNQTKDEGRRTDNRPFVFRLLSFVQFSRRTDWSFLVAILLIAAFLRLYQLDAIPPGWTHDEAGHGHDAVAILHGARPIYETVGYGREPLYDYVVAGLMALIGAQSVTAGLYRRV